MFYAGPNGMYKRKYGAFKTADRYQENTRRMACPTPPSLGSACEFDRHPPTVVSGFSKWANPRLSE